MCVIFFKNIPSFSLCNNISSSSSKQQPIHNNALSVWLLWHSYRPGIAKYSPAHCSAACNEYFSSVCRVHNICCCCCFFSSSLFSPLDFPYIVRLLQHSTHSPVKVFDRLLANDVFHVMHFVSFTNHKNLRCIAFLFCISEWVIRPCAHETIIKILKSNALVKRVLFHFSWVSSYLTASTAAATATTLNTTMVDGGQSRFPS